MIPDQTFLHRARVTIELSSPMMLASGQSQIALDNDLMRDENRRPMVPGTSITGVLRHLLQRLGHPLSAKFGYADEDNNHISSIQISSAQAHDANNQVREADKTLTSDPVLSLLEQDAPIMRHGVAINTRGVVDNDKFDRSLVPTGTRFTFEISLWSEQSEAEQWHTLLSLLCHPLCCLGGGTRAGLGAFKVITINHIILDLTQANDADVFRQLPKSLSSIAGALQPLDLHDLTALARELLPVTTQQITLVPENGWRVGGGTTSLTGLVKSSQLLPYTETVIDWHNEKASLKTQTLVMPGSSIKGAFSHRFEFHYRRLTQQWAQKDKQFTYRDTNTRQLFGWVDGEEGQKGHFWFNDSYVMSNVAVHHRTRNKIDRLTGGTIDKALFAEERVYNDSLTIEFIWDHQALEEIEQGLKDDLHTALDLTTRDLKTARLALGAGQNNGAGYFYEKEEG